MLQPHGNIAAKAAQKRRGNLLGLIHRRNAIQLLIAGAGRYRLSRPRHIAIPLIQPPCAIALVRPCRQVVQVIGLMPEGQAACDFLILQAGNPVDQTPRHAAELHFCILIDADLRDCRNSACIMRRIIGRPVNLFVPDIAEIVHMHGNIPQAVRLQLMPCNNVRHTVIVCTKLKETLITAFRNISPIIRPCQRCVCIH